MADPVLHIKDSYYFEVPKLLYPYDLHNRKDFPEIWISLDPEYQEWEFGRLYQDLTLRDAGLPAKEQAHEDWHHWVHADHANFAKPLAEFLEEKYQGYVAKFDAWKAAQLQEARTKSGSVEEAKRLNFSDYVKQLKPAETPDAAYLKFLEWRHKNAASFAEAKAKARDIEAWKTDSTVADWSPDKIKAYNGQLSGRILIPQPFAKLRNLYEKESGFAISKYMIIEVVIGLILCVVFAQLARQIEHGQPARGKLWNLLETFLVFIRDQIARTVIEPAAQLARIFTAYAAKEAA
jgi:F-type H+-transporting ATPase subunit a